MQLQATINESECFDVSVCLPLYNGEKYLRTCIESLLNQKFTGRFELIIRDDGSADNSVDLATSILKYAALPYRILKGGKNIGLVRNWNACISEARGTYVSMLFQDDWYETGFIEVMHRAAVATNAALVLCDRRYVFEEGVGSKTRKLLSTEIPRLRHVVDQPTVFEPEDISRIAFDDFLGRNFLGEPIAGLIRRDAIKKYGGFDEDLNQICDFEYWLRLSTNEGLYFIPDALVCFRVHGGSTSKKNSGTMKSIADRITLGHRILHSESFERFRRDVPGGHLAIKQKYERKLESYFRDVNYQELLSVVPIDIREPYLTRLKPSWFVETRRRVRRLVRTLGARLKRRMEKITIRVGGTE